MYLKVVIYVNSFLKILGNTVHNNGVVKPPLNNVLSRFVYWVDGGK
jgi:hypothetical protein